MRAQLERTKSLGSKEQILRFSFDSAISGQDQQHEKNDGGSKPDRRPPLISIRELPLHPPQTENGVGIRQALFLLVPLLKLPSPWRLQLQQQQQQQQHAAATLLWRRRRRRRRLILAATRAPVLQCLLHPSPDGKPV